jgi:hypothetical protein
MAAVLATLRADFDFVIIDAPPILPVSDAAVLAAGADGAVLVARYGKTRREQLTSAIADLDAVKARLIGTALTMVPARGQRDLRGHDEDYAALSTVSESEWAATLPTPPQGGPAREPGGSARAPRGGAPDASTSAAATGESASAQARQPEPAQAPSRPDSLDPKVVGTSFSKALRPSGRGRVH